MPRIHEFSRIYFYCACDEGLPRIARIFTNDYIIVLMKGYHKLHKFPQIDFIMACDEGLPRIARIFTNDYIIVVMKGLPQIPSNWFYHRCDEGLPRIARIAANWFLLVCDKRFATNSRINSCDKAKVN